MSMEKNGLSTLKEKRGTAGKAFPSDNGLMDKALKHVPEKKAKQEKHK